MEDLTPSEMDQLEMAMVRRADAQLECPDSVPFGKPLRDIIPVALGRVEILPGRLISALNIAHGEMVRSRKTANLKRAERQLLHAWADVCCYRALQQVRRMRGAI